MYGLKAPKSALYMGNSGTSMRLLSGMLSAQKFDSVMTGDASLSKRPMERIAKPLRLMGAQIQTTGERGTPPVSITGNQNLKGIQYDLPMASAQVKSGILLAGLWAEGETSVTEPEPTRDHTERMLRAFGYDVKLKLTVFPCKVAANWWVPIFKSHRIFLLLLSLWSVQRLLKMLT